MSSKKDLASSRLVSKKEKIFNWIIFVLLLLGAVVMVFPLIYMIATSFMTKNQILSGTLTSTLLAYGIVPSFTLSLNVVCA